MFKFIKNKFLFIVIISVLTLVLLIVGAIALYKDNTKSFSDGGYIISSTTKKNAKYYFSSNTKYKTNADNNIVFKDSDSKSVTISPQNFVHYSDGSIGFLTKGALVNLTEINSPALNYYNVNDNNLINYRNNSYSVESKNKNINIESFMGRISDNKYIIAGKGLVLKVPNSDQKITGDYFEVLFIENGVVKIDNQEASYQVTAQNTSISVGDNIIIDLGTEKISYNGDVKMLMSQLTINGDENINLDVVEKNNNDNNENGSETGTGTSTENTNDNNENNDNNDNNETQDNKNSDNQESGGSGGGGAAVNPSAKIELIEADVTSTSLLLSFQLNNASAISGNLIAILKNVNNGNKEYEKEIEVKNGTFRINKNSLSPSTEYTLTITEINKKSEKQYFQKTFKTSDLGVTLEKEYATAHSLAYQVKFDENTDANKVRLVIYDNNGDNDSIGINEYIVSASDINKTIEFVDLGSNRNYSVRISSVWIGNVSYSDVYTINRIDTTLKETPILSNIEVKADPDLVKFNIKVKNIEDPDKGIVSYKYYIYKADDITIDNPNPDPVYMVTKNDADAIDLNLNEIKELKTGVDYRCKVVALYDDNVMIREAESDYSKNFLIKTKPNISWTLGTTTMNKVTGTLKLIDANCSVPVLGRECQNRNNTFTLRYYKTGEEENLDNTVQINFDGKSLTSNVTLSGLSSNTTYAVKMYSNYYDDNNVLHKDVQFGDIFYIKTDQSENLKFKVIGDNESGKNKDGTPNSANIVTFDGMFEKPKDSTLDEEVSSITLNLYSGSYNVEEKLIGTTTIKNKNTIQDFFSNYTITNNIFVNEELGNINSLSKLIRLTNNQTNTLNGTYTVEIVDVLDSTGRNKIPVEDNIYTFRLTPSYYLDSRIATNPAYKYITVTQIKKEDLTASEYTELSKSVSNLDDLNDDTVVGIIIENSLSDTFVDSAFTYEKVVVDYIAYNNVTKKEVARLSTDMGNKYQPKSKIIYLDEKEINGEDNFVRGYDYKIGYELKFVTEKGDNPTYKNDRLSQNVTIKRQTPIYIQYISKSNVNSITYRYSITDIDNALYDKKLYYSYTDSKDNKGKSEEEIITDGTYHNITIPLSEKKEYSIYLNEKNTAGSNSYVEINKYTFESEYTYNNNITYNLVNDEDNTLKIKLIDNDVTNRAAAYKVTIKTTDNSVKDYVRFFLASKLNTKEISTGEIDENGDEVTTEEKYITIDYASIHEYMKHDLTVSVESYFDSGLVGFNQEFTNGLILKNNDKFLNIYNSGSSTASTDSEEKELNGVYMQKSEYTQDSDNMSLFNYLYNTKNYNKLSGTSYYLTNELDRNIGINYRLSYTNNGIVFINGNKEYSGYNTKLVKVANLNTNNKNYRFNSITPKVSLDSSKNTINSLNLKVNSTGVYGQFIKDGQEHNVYYIDIYNDSELTNRIKTLTSNITITDNTATSEEVSLNDLKPNTTYYVTISAYVNGRLTKLYDMNSSNGYVVKTYESKTLSANSILEKITYSVKPTSYNNNGTSNKTLSWNLNLKNTENYKLRFELYDRDGNPVNFDGSNANNCDNTVNGNSSNSYISNCYIQIPKEDIATINRKDINYEFSGDNFVFGGNYYKLILYAIPYMNNQYDEANKLIIYQNDSLSTTGDKTVSGEPNYNITIPTLEEATFNLKDTLISGTRCVTVKDDEGNSIKDENGNFVCDTNVSSNRVEYYIEFTPTVIDKSYVMKNGKYTVILKDSSNKPIQDPKRGNALAVNKNITFTDLNSNSLYYIELTYEAYRNNVDYSETQKITVTPFTDFIYTPIDAGITLGNITANQSGNKAIVLAYSGASNMVDHITKVAYTISLKGGISKTSGEYVIDDEHPNIFNISTDKVPRLTINLEESSDTNFILRSGNTYIISTQYYYKENGIEKMLEDKTTSNNTFTTILNL